MGINSDNEQYSLESNNDTPIEERKSTANSNYNQALFTAVHTVSFFENLTNDMENDELLRYIYRNRLSEEIFNKVEPLEFYYRVDLNRKRDTFSTKEVAVILGFDDSQRLLNLYNRVDGILDYLKLQRTGGGPRGLYKHSYVTLFKLFLYFYLIDTKGIKTNEIYALLNLNYESNIVYDQSSTRNNRHTVYGAYEESAASEKEEKPFNKTGANLVTREELRTEVGKSLYETNQMMMMFADSVNTQFKEISSVLKRQNELFANRLLTTNNTFIENLQEQDRYFKQHQADLTSQIETVTEEIQDLTIKVELVRFQKQKRLDFEKDLNARLTEVSNLLNEVEKDRLTEQNSSNTTENKKAGLFARIFGNSAEPKIITKVDYDRLIESYKSEINIINQDLASPRNSEAIEQEMVLLHQQLQRKITQAESLKQKLVEIQEAIINVTTEISDAKHRVAADEKLIEDSNDDSMHLQLDTMVSTLRDRLSGPDAIEKTYDDNITTTDDDVVIEVITADNRK